MPWETWEYMTQFISANIDHDSARKYLTETWPEWKNPPKFTPETMVPILNNWGKAGWELIHLEPVPEVGNNGDIKFPGDLGIWSHVYFCVFKRRLYEPSTQISCHSHQTEGMDMQNWEYLFITCDYVNDDWHPRYVNSQELKDWKKTLPLPEFSNTLGQEGWELINLSTQGAGDKTYIYRLVFKRPIQ